MSKLRGCVYKGSNTFCFCCPFCDRQFVVRNKRNLKIALMHMQLSHPENVEPNSQQLTTMFDKNKQILVTESNKQIGHIPPLNTYAL